MLFFAKEQYSPDSDAGGSSLAPNEIIKNSEKIISCVIENCGIPEINNMNDLGDILKRGCEAMMQDRAEFIKRKNQQINLPRPITVRRTSRSGGLFVEVSLKMMKLQQMS